MLFLFKMFRSPQFVTSGCLLGIHRSLLMTVTDSQTQVIGRTVCNISLSQQFCTFRRENGHQCKHEMWNKNCITEENVHKSFSCPVNTSCSVKPSDTYHNVAIKGVTTADVLSHFFGKNSKHHSSNATLAEHFIFRDAVAKKCLVLENLTEKHKCSGGKWRRHLNGSIKSQKSCHTTIGGTPLKGLVSRPYELNRWLWTSSAISLSHSGFLRTQTCGLHKQVLHKTTFEECLSAGNEARCRGHLQPNTALYEKEKGKSWAAVLVSLCVVGGEPSFLFTLRSSKLRGRHKGDVSFAGGKRDASDRNIVDTALREAREELGIAVNENKVWGVLKPLRDVSGMTIAPVLANLGSVEALTFRPNPTEVEEIFTLTVAHVSNPLNRGYTHFRTGDHYGYTLPVFHNSKYRIWGLTAVALDHTLKVIMAV